jgi:alpha-maltose-1-phosphate synthase
MKALVLYDYPPSPGGLAMQGDLLFRGLKETGVEAHAVHYASAQEKEWYYRWFEPDVVIGVGYWGYTPHLVLHPQRYGVRPVPWLVADGYVASFQEVRESLPLLLVASSWVKDVYVRDGIKGDNIHVLPVGCDTDAFIPRDRTAPKVAAVRESFGVAPDQVMILTVGGDAASKGAQEVMQALSLIDKEAPDWKYVCKVWPQLGTTRQNMEDMRLATNLGIEKNVVFATGVGSRDFMPYLLAACDIYAAPARLEGFGMPQVESGACGRPVIGLNAMAMRDTLVHGETALLANVSTEVTMQETVVGGEQGYGATRRIVFENPRTVEFRANVHNLSEHLMTLMTNPSLREKLGQAGRRRICEHYDYRVVARRFTKLVGDHLGVS